MMFAKGLHPGAVWHKCDFQCHTPRDRAWSGSPHLPGGTAELEQARHAWAEEFVNVALARKLKAVAVTDHHDICLSTYVLAAAERLGGEIKVFPGIEVTCSDAGQCLALFDPTSTEEKQGLLLALAGNVLAAPKDDPITADIAPARSTVLDLFTNVAAEVHLRDLTVLLPHFSKEDAHKSINVAQHHPRFAALNCDGVYIERPFSDLDQTTIDKIQGKIAEWGDRRRAVIATGDNKTASWHRLGANDCWVKLGEHSIEAVRQALLADEARITFTTPDVPPERLVEMRVLSKLTGPDPMRLSFNDGFTALIGGRGSGKSALLEFVRFGLGRTDSDMDAASQSSSHAREKDLINDTLADGGFVEVILEREGVRETWKRALTSKQAIEVMTSTGMTTITPQAARERFRARAFRQKGLSSTMNDPGTAADQITGIAAAEELNRQREVERAIQNSKRNVTTALQNLAAYWQVRLEHRQAQDRVADLKQRLAAVNAKLTEEGVSPEHVATIESAPKHARAISYLEIAKAQIETDAERIGELGDGILNITTDEFEGVSDFEEIAALQASIDGTRVTVGALLTQAVSDVQGLIAKFAERETEYAARKEEFDEAHRNALEQQDRHRNLIDDNTRLVGELEAAERARARAATSEAEKSQAPKGYTDAVRELDALLEERREILRTAAEKVAGRSSGLLKARIQRDKRPDELVTALCALFEATYTQQAKEGCEQWASAVAEQIDGLSALRGRLLALYENKIASGSPPEPGEEATGTIADVMFDGARILTAQQVKRIYDNLNDATIGQVLSATPRDTIVLSYMDDGQAIDFKKASPGQQASALLELLLSQSAGTLLIDQPEDDLDNRVIMRIVALVRTSKSHRQLIFATHNPNVVVNGDADKIVALRSMEPTSNPNLREARVQIDTDGAIETPEVQNAITSIMEGGREAFDLRSRKYRFDVTR